MRHKVQRQLLLAKIMRLKEDDLYKLTGYRLKITERVGPSLKSQLVRSDR